MVTIKEIANLAQVSTATVSHVLNDTAKISEETRRKVLKIVKELNYRPNSIAKSLKIKKTHTIGIITEDISVFNAPDIIDGINEYAEEQGYHIILNNVRLCKKIGRNYNDTSKYAGVISGIADILLGKQVDGIIYVGSHCRDVSGVLEVDGVPIVYVYCYTADDGSYFVNYDDEKAAYDVTRYLIENGHRKIAVISGLYDSLPSQARFRGYQRAIDEFNMLYNPQYVKVGDWEYESGFRIGKELMQLSDRPTAIWAMNDLMAGGVIDAAKELGLDIPGDLSLIGFDNREFSFFYTPKLTTMKLPLNEMGKTSAKVLIELLDDKNSPEQRFIRLKCELIERESVKSI